MKKHKPEQIVALQRQSEAGVAAQLDAHTGKGAFQSRYDPQQHGHDAGVTGSIARSQTHAQQASGVTLENQHGMVHVLFVGAVEETELLLAVRGIVGGIDVQQNLAALADLPAPMENCSPHDSHVTVPHSPCSRACASF
jgi:hypothetical protein